MFELVHQQYSTPSPIKSFYPSLGAAYLAAKRIPRSGTFKLEVRNQAGQTVLSWK